MKLMSDGLKQEISQYYDLLAFSQFSGDLNQTSRDRLTRGKLISSNYNKVGDRQTGKTSIGLDTIINQQYERVFCVYLPVGQKASQILSVYLTLASRDCMFYTSVLMASASASPLQQFLSVYSGSAICEYFMYLKDLPCFIMFDDLSKHAIAYREIYLLLRRPPGREAYPGEIFYVHSKLLERSAKLLQVNGQGGGSLQGLYITSGFFQLWREQVVRSSCIRSVRSQ